MWAGRRAAKCDTQPRAQPVLFAFPAAELASGMWQRERIACGVPNVLPFPSGCLKWRLFAPSVMPVRQQLCQGLLSSSHAGGSSWVQVRFPSAYRHEAALGCQTKGLAGKMKILLLLYTRSVLFTCFLVMHILISDTENQKCGVFSPSCLPMRPGNTSTAWGCGCLHEQVLGVHTQAKCTAQMQNRLKYIALISAISCH